MPQRSARHRGSAGSWRTLACIDIALDDKTIVWRNADVEQERRIAIYDLIEDNSFAPARASTKTAMQAPTRCSLSCQEGRLVIEIRRADDSPLEAIILGLASFRRPIKDYFAIFESYFEAIRQATPAQIETVGMARRGIHNQGARSCSATKLDGKIAVDFDTARRLLSR